MTPAPIPGGRRPRRKVAFAERRWGHGRLRQLLLRAFRCHWGHEWDETHWEDGVGIARCKTGCGAQLWQREDPAMTTTAHDYKTWQDVDHEDLARAWVAVREGAGLSRDDVCDITGLPMPWLELVEDYGDWPDLSQFEALTEAYKMSTPAALLDALYNAAIELTVDLDAERDVDAQADRLLELLKEHGAVTHAQMEAANVSTYNAPFNRLYDRGLPVEIVRSHDHGLGHQTPTGVRLRGVPE